MQITQVSKIASTTGDAWTDLVNVACTVTSVVLSATGIGSVSVSVQVKKSAGATAFIVPGDELPEGASARLRLPSVVLEDGDKLQVKSSGPVDWIASAIVMSES